MNMLIVSGTVIIIALAAYAGWLHYRLWQRDRQREANRQGVAGFDPAAIDNNRVELRKSIYLLADALLDDKMTHTEGCLRICAVASNLEDQAIFRQEYAVLFEVAEATAHIPILDDWRALDREDQKRLTRERQAIEETHGAAVEEAAKRLKDSFARLI